MNYLITGGLGLIGKKLTDQLIKRGHKVVVVDNQKLKKKKRNYIYYKIDITKKNDLLKNYLKKHKINSIIHLAAFLGVKTTEQSPEQVIKVNFNGTKNVLYSCLKSKVREFIFSSSSEVYGDQRSKFRENLTLIPKSFYGFSKYQAELIVKNFSIKNRISYKIIRFFNIYGPKQKKLFVIPKFVNLAKKNKDLNVYGEGNQVRSFCFVDDAVEGLIKIIESNLKNDIFNIGNDKEPISVIGLAKKIVKILKSKSKIKKIPFEMSDRKKDREIFKRVPDLKKIRSLTGYKPKKTLLHGIKLISK